MGVKVPFWKGCSVATRPPGTMGIELGAKENPNVVAEQ
jgi:hypothetical protein